MELKLWTLSSGASAPFLFVGASKCNGFVFIAKRIKKNMKRREDEERRREGFTDLEKLRKASTETMYTVADLYNAVTKNDVYLINRPIVDGYASLKNFDVATRHGSISEGPSMLCFT